MNPYLDLNYQDRTEEVEQAFEAAFEEIKHDPNFYAELVNDLMFHWVYGTRETKIMMMAKENLIKFLNDKTK